MRRLIVLTAAVLIASPAAAESEERIADEASCRFANAIYELVEQEDDRADAKLKFRPFDSVAGLAGTMRTPGGDMIDFTITFNNGASRYWAIMDLGDGVEISPHIQTFTADMASGGMNAEDPAPQYVVFPLAGFEAYHEQKSRPLEEVINPPEGAWRLSDCRP